MAPPFGRRKSRRRFGGRKCAFFSRPARPSAHRMSLEKSLSRWKKANRFSRSISNQSRPRPPSATSSPASSTSFFTKAISTRTSNESPGRCAVLASTSPEILILTKAQKVGVRALAEQHESGQHQKIEDHKRQRKIVPRRSPNGDGSDLLHVLVEVFGFRLQLRPIEKADPQTAKRGNQPRDHDEGHREPTMTHRTELRKLRRKI